MLFRFAKCEIFTNKRSKICRWSKIHEKFEKVVEIVEKARFDAAVQSVDWSHEHTRERYVVGRICKR